MIAQLCLQHDRGDDCNNQPIMVLQFDKLRKTAAIRGQATTNLGAVPTK